MNALVNNYDPWTSQEKLKDGICVSCLKEICKSEIFCIVEKCKHPSYKEIMSYSWIEPGEGHQFFTGIDPILYRSPLKKVLCQNCRKEYLKALQSI